MWNSHFDKPRNVLTFLFETMLLSSICLFFHWPRPKIKRLLIFEIWTAFNDQCPLKTGISVFAQTNRHVGKLRSDNGPGRVGSCRGMFVLSSTHCVTYIYIFMYRLDLNPTSFINEMRIPFLTQSES